MNNSSHRQNRGIIRALAEHRILPNLLILAMLLSGLFVANRLEVRFFPKFEIQTIAVSISQPGASAEDIADSVLPPLENTLRDTNNLKKISSRAQAGSGSVYLEFSDKTDIQIAADDIRRRVAQSLAKLPTDSKRPKVRIIEQRNEIMRLSLSGDNLTELRRLARRLENQLLQLGIVRVEISGLPKDEIQIRLSQQLLAQLQLSPRAIGEQLAQQNIDATAGDIGNTSNKRLLRVVSKRKRLTDFTDMTVIDGSGNVVRLGDIADIRRNTQDNAVKLFFDGRPAVEFRLSQNSGDNILNAAERVHAWLEETRATLPAGIELTAHRERWIAVRSRLDLLLENGLQGLALVMLCLLLFLRAHVAFWIAAGIPATFMVALTALYLTGSSINMISLFAFIMVTGIVVDDAIVVGENSAYYLKQGRSPIEAAVSGAREMFAAVFSSTFTTIASFFPLLIVGGVVGAIMFAIPLVVICVLLASLFECFCVLPGHLQNAFHSLAKKPPAQWRQRIDDAFERFQEGPFRRSVALALRHRWVTITTMFTCLTLALALIIGGFLQYRFFPSAQLNTVRAQASFVAGTPHTEVAAFMRELEKSAHQTAKDFPNENRLLRHLSTYLGLGGERQAAADENATLWMELSPSENRNITASEFTRALRKNAPTSTALEKLVLRESRGGPGGEDLEIRLTGNDYDTLKAAALDLQNALADINGVNRPSDDMPYGQRQTVFDINERGKALNLSVAEIARQLRDAFDGYRVQTLYEGVDETEVRVFADGGDIDNFRLRLPNGDAAALSDVASLRERRGFDVILRVDTKPAVHVVGNIDFRTTSANQVTRQLQRDVLPAIAARHGVAYSFEGSRADENETVGDMKTGLLIALLSIFVILAAVFSSWSLPFAVLLTLPFGIIGAVVGHWLLGHDLSILSAFGIFSLNGIIVNDSIILVREYLNHQKRFPDANNDALIVNATCRRLRAILLTSLTTVGGLIPLLFERSMQAQFLIPMAISISFGLAFASLLILYLIPAFLSVRYSAKKIIGRIRVF